MSGLQFIEPNALVEKLSIGCQAEESGRGGLVYPHPLRFTAVKLDGMGNVRHLHIQGASALDHRRARTLAALFDCEVYLSSDGQCHCNPETDD